MLKLWHLSVINEVIKTGSISQAARALGRSQPALSLVIADVEAMIGYPLFEREHGRLRPVPEAYYFLDRAEIILDQINGLEQAMKEGTTRFSEIRIACMPVLSEFFMPQQIASFAESRPGLRFIMRAQSSQRVLESIASQQFDLGLAEQAGSSALYNARSFTLEAVVALPAEDPLAAEAVVTPAMLDARPMTCFLPDHHLTTALQSAFKATNAHLNIPFHLQNGAAQHALVASGQACGFFSPMIVWLYHHLGLDKNDGGIIYRPFRPLVQQQVSLLTPKHRPLSQQSMQFAAEVETAIGTLLDGAKEIISSQKA